MRLLILLILIANSLFAFANIDDDTSKLPGSPYYHATAPADGNDDRTKNSLAGGWNAYATLNATYTSGDVVPFWLRANKFGSIPLKGMSVSAAAHVEKNYAVGKFKKGLDWGMGFEGRLNAGTKIEFIPVEAYLKAHWGPIQLKAGRSKDIMGLVDSTLSMGAFAIAGNAVGIPKVEISMPDYWQVPIFNKLVAVKGNFGFGWMGEVRIVNSLTTNSSDNRRPGTNSVKTLFHQKSFYTKFGKPGWRLKLYGGFSHHSEFGNEDIIYTNFNLSKLQSFYYAITGKTWFAENGFSTKLGNQMGSIDVALDYTFKNLSVFAYHQFFYEVGALAHLANLRDGLTGLRFVNNNNESCVGLQWKKILVEFLYSKNQAGELTSRPTPSGDEDYYNNYLYIEGWSYKGNALGNPFFTLKSDANAGLPSLKWQNFINNRIVGGNIGAELQYNNFHVTTKLSYTRNYGTFGTSKIGLSTGSRRSVQPPPYFPDLGQFSGYLGFVKIFNAKWTAIVEFGLDRGELLPNSVGTSIGIKRNLLP